MTTSARHHMILRADIARPPTNPEIAKDWLLRLIPAIGMKLAEIPNNPLTWYCERPENRGVTTTAIIETSNITLHTWDEKFCPELQLDVFTCGDLDIEIVIKMLDEFSPLRMNILLLDRSEYIMVKREIELFQ